MRVNSGLTTLGLLLAVVLTGTRQAAQTVTIQVAGS
jgi:hypothetical protein